MAQQLGYCLLTYSMSFDDRYSDFAFHCLNGSSLQVAFLDAEIRYMLEMATLWANLAKLLLTDGGLPALAHLVGGVVHDRVAVVGAPVGVALFALSRALLELLLLAGADVVPVDGDDVVSVGAHVGVVHADAVEDLDAYKVESDSSEPFMIN